MKSKVIFHFVLGLVGFFHLKASSIKFSRTTFLELIVVEQEHIQMSHFC